MGAHHRLQIETDSGHDVVFVCTDAGCGRRLAINRQTRELTIVVQGDFHASHSGGTSGLQMGLSVA